MAAVLLVLAVTLLVHEAGHALVAAVLRLPWRPTVTWRGPGIIIGREDLRLTRRQVVLTAAGGPAANVAVAYVGLRLGQPLVVMVGVEFALMNLLPFPHSDGSRMLRPGRAIAAARSASGTPPVAAGLGGMLRGSA